MEERARITTKSLLRGALSTANVRTAIPARARPARPAAPPRADPAAEEVTPVAHATTHPTPSRMQKMVLREGRVSLALAPRRGARRTLISGEILAVLTGYRCPAAKAAWEQSARAVAAAVRAVTV